MALALDSALAFGPDFGPGFGPGGFGPGGPGFRRGLGPGGRMFGRGDLKYALLELLQERPKHGYEMIKELENRAGGFYTPSAGAVYPTLQLLEDRGWVRSQTQEGKKVYTITDAGRQDLAEHQARWQAEAERAHQGEAAQVAGAAGVAGAATDTIMADSTRLRKCGRRCARWLLRGARWRG